MGAFYAIQPAFTGGEISPDVASRVDIDKYQLALLQAENAIIRPYGAATKALSGHQHVPSRYGRESRTRRESERADHGKARRRIRAAQAGQGRKIHGAGLHEPAEGRDGRRERSGRRI